MMAVCFMTTAVGPDESVKQKLSERKKEMKKTRSKIIMLALALALVIGATAAIVASAEGEYSPLVMSKNIAYEDNFRIMYAVDPATVEAAPVTLNVYTAEPGEGVTPSYSFSAAEAEEIKISGVSHSAYVIKTNGIAAKDMADVFYLQAVDANGNKGEVCTYSVMEYMLERLYGDYELSEKQRTVYEKALEFGAAAQDLLTTGETLVTDYRYVKGGEGVLVNGKSAVIAKAGEELELTYAGGTVATWNVYDNAGALVGNIPAKDAVVAEGHYTYEADTSFRGTGLYADHPNTVTFNGVTATELKNAGIIGSCTVKGDATVDGTSGNYVAVKNDAFVFNKQASGEVQTTLVGAGSGTNFVVEFDFMLDPDANFTDGNRSDETAFQIIGVNNGSGTDYSLPLPSIMFTDLDGDGEDEPVITAWGSKFEAVRGEWYNVRLEIPNSAQGSVYYGYLNGEKVTDEADVLTKAFTRNSLCIIAMNQPRFTVYLDNLFFGDPDKGNGLYADKAIDFDDLTAVPTYTAEDWDFAYVKGNESQGTIAAPSDRDKFFQLKRTSDSSRLDYAIKRQGTSNTFVFEADMYLADLPTGAHRELVFGATSKDATADNPYEQNAWGNHSVKLIYDEALGYNVITVAGIVIEFEQNEWFNLRVEYDGTSTGSKVRAYLNGELVGEGELSAYCGGFIAFDLYSLGDSDVDCFTGTVRLDNIYLGDK